CAMWTTGIRPRPPYGVLSTLREGARCLPRECAQESRLCLLDWITNAYAESLVVANTLESQPKRDYIKLLDAMRCVVRALYDETISERQALHQSFESAVEGFRSEKALLVLVDEGAGDSALRAVESRGLTAEQVRACE